MANSGHTKSAKYLAALFGLVALFFSPALSNTFIFRDAFNLFFPYKAVEAGYLKGLSICLWNPWEVLGTSFVGELATGWFYPGNVFFMILQPEPAYRLFIFSHYLLAALFVWLWLREEGRTRTAATSGALAYTLSGYILSQNGMPDMLAACAWLPGSLWIVRLYIKNRKPVFIAFLGVSLAMPFLAGRAEAVIISGVACACLVLISEESGEKLSQRFAALVKLLAEGGAVALLLSMVQFLPSLELGRISLKGQGFSLSESTLWSFHPARLLEFLASSPWGRFWPDATYKAGSLTGWEDHYPWALSHYTGLVMLAGTAVALMKASRKKSAAVAVMLAAVIGYSAGRYFVLYPALFKLMPFLHIFRYPEKYMVLAVVLLTASGAYGIDVIMERLQKGISRKHCGLIATAAIALPVVALIAGALLPSSGYGFISADHLGFQMAHAAFILAALAGLALVAGASRRAYPASAAGIILICAFDLLLANHHIIPYAGPDIFDYEPAALKEIREHSQSAGKGFFNADGKPVPGRFRVMREPGGPPDYALGMIEGDYDYEKYQRWKRHTLSPNFNFITGVEQITGYTAAMTGDYDRLMKEHLNLESLRLFNVHYLVEPLYRGSRKSSLPEIAADPRGFGVYSIPHPFPRAYMVGQSKRLEDPLSRPELLKSHDFTKAVILQDSRSLPSPSSERPLEMVPAKIASYEPARVVIDAFAPRPCYLVLSDSFYPGWRATVDGEEKQIIKANFLVRAVRLQAGEHEVVFEYQPSMYYAGRAVSLATAILIIAVFIRSAWRTVYKRPS